MSYTSAQGKADIYDHEVTISAQAYLPVDDTMIPTGTASISLTLSFHLFPY